MSSVNVVPWVPISARVCGITASDASVWSSVRTSRTLGGGSVGSVDARYSHWTAVPRVTVRDGLNFPSGKPPATSCSAAQATALPSWPAAASGNGLGAVGSGRPATRHSHPTTCPRVTVRRGRKVWSGYPPTTSASLAQVAASWA